MTIVVTVTSPTGLNYAKLQSDVANWLARDDLSVEVQDFIRFAESDVCKDLRVRGMEKKKTFTVTDAPNTLPTDFLGARRLYVDVATGSRKLDYLTPERFHNSTVSQLVGTPQAYTIEGGEILFAPMPGVDAPVDVRMLYIGNYDTLVDPGDTHSLLSKHYDLYLYGALIHGFAFVRDDSETLKYKGQYDEYVNKLNRNANRERMAGNTLRRTGRPTP